MHTVWEVSALPGTRSWPLNPKSSFPFRASQHCYIHSPCQPLPRRNAPASGWSQGADPPTQLSPDTSSQLRQPAVLQPGELLALFHVLSILYSFACRVFTFTFFFITCILWHVFEVSFWVFHCQKGWTQSTFPHAQETWKQIFSFGSYWSLTGRICPSVLPLIIIIFF